MLNNKHLCSFSYPKISDRAVSEELGVDDLKLRSVLCTERLGKQNRKHPRKPCLKDDINSANSE